MNNNSSANAAGNHTSRRVSHHREKIGNKVQKQDTEQIERSLKIHLASQFFEQARHCQSGTQTKNIIPITTRGLLFNLAHSFDTVIRQNPKIARYAPPVAPLVRITLLQALKMSYEAHRAHFHGEFQDYVIDQQIAGPIQYDDKFESLISTNFSLVTTSLRAMGCFEFAEGKYCPKVFPCSNITLEVPVVQEQGQEQAGSPQRRAEIAEITVVSPDPYLVTFSSIRDILTSLTDVRVPVAIRHQFRMLNPIPGLTWAGDLLVTNPDDVMPADYTSVQFEQDQQTCIRFFSSIKGIDSALVHSTVLDGKGTPATLATTCQVRSLSEPGDVAQFAIENLLPTAPVNFPTQTVRCAFPIPSSDLMLASAAMMSEYPVYLATRFEERWASRSPWISTHSIDISWFSLASGILHAVKPY